MTQKSWPWSTVAAVGDGAAELNEASSREFLALYFGVQDPTVEGVSKGVLGELAVSGNASPLTVQPGSAICYGLYLSDAVVNPTVATPAVGTTGGRVVLQTNWAGTGGASLEARTRIAVKLNTDGNAAIPALTQSFGTTWEISLFTFTITTGGVITLTDDRTFRRSSAVVGTDEVDDAAINTAKLADNAVTTVKITDANVTLAKLAADSVDDTKAGNRVPQFYRRQGGNASAWATGGTTDYIPTSVRQQAGVAAISGPTGVTFPTAFSNTPIVVVTFLHATSTGFAYLSAVTASGFTVNAKDAAGNDVNGNVHWFAVGPE